MNNFWSRFTSLSAATKILAFGGLALGIAGRSWAVLALLGGLTALGHGGFDFLGGAELRRLPATPRYHDSGSCQARSALCPDGPVRRR